MREKGLYNFALNNFDAVTQSDGVESFLTNDFDLLKKSLRAVGKSINTMLLM